MASEFDLINRFFVRKTPGASLGPGDDCALIQPSAGMELAVTTDMLVAGTHFFSDTDPVQLGWKTMAVNLSDLAAMGAKPRWVLLAGSLPNADESWLAKFSQGVFQCLDRFGVDLIGGDTTKGPLNLCVTAIGELPIGSALRRDCATAEDDLWVSGWPGLASLGLKFLQNRCSLPLPLQERCLAALHSPIPRVELGMALRERSLAKSAMDVSDGLVGDLHHILERSTLSAEIWVDALPVDPSVPTSLKEEAVHSVLHGGDDYELLFSSHQRHRAAIVDLGQQLGVAVNRIGVLRSSCEESCDPQVVLRQHDGSELVLSEKGFDHFV